MALRETVTGQTFDELISGAAIPVLTKNMTILSGSKIDVLTRIQSLDKYQQASVLKDLFG